MKTIPLIISLLLFSCMAQGQVYWDALTAGAQSFHAGIINRQMKTTNKNLSSIEKAQIAIVTELKVITDIQNKIHKGLTEVTAALRNLSDIKEITRLGGIILDDISDIMDFARRHPEYLIFAESGARQVRERSMKMAGEVSGFFLSGKNLMDSGERAKLINRMLTDMLILRSLTYGMYRSMKNAHMAGFWRSVNPFQGYINRDGAIVQDILRNVKHISR